MNKILCIISLALLALLLPGCGSGADFAGMESIVFKKLNELALSYKKGTEEFELLKDHFPIACYYFDPTKKDYGQSLPIWDQTWVWAQTKEYPHILAKGQEEGGFVVSDQIYAWNFRENKAHPVEVNASEMGKLCQKAIDIIHPGQGLRFYRMAVSKSLSSIDEYPLVVDERNSPNKITRIVIFGDSMSNTNSLNRPLRPSPLRPFFLGRFSNGPVWNDYLADLADVTIENISQGGAVTKSNVGISIDDIVTLIREVGRSLTIGSIHEFVDEYLKSNDFRIVNPDKTLFFIWAGANDYLSKFDNAEDLKNLIDNPDLPHKGGNSIAKMSANNIAAEIIRLYEAGARNFAIGNLPDIGLTPSIESNTTYELAQMPKEMSHYRLSKELSRITILHNKFLAEKIAELKKKLSDPNTRIIMFDAAKALKNLMEKRGPKGERNFDYGIDVEKSFTELMVPGKKPIRIGRKCYIGGYLGSTDDRQICNNASQMLFWDELHPTTVAHCGISFLLHTLLFDEGMVAPKPDFNEYKKLCK